MKRATLPTYQYRCTECGHDLEAVQKFSDAALTECPSCHGQLRKVYNAVGVVFKGSGFYRTDSRPKEGASVGASGEKPSSADASTKDSGKNGAGKNGAGKEGAGTKESSSTNGSGSKPAGAPKVASSTGSAAAS
jgi:putative FmdB family regulatory protein